LLASHRPFAPGNRDLFHTFARADWADVAPLGAPPLHVATEHEAMEQLRSFLERRFPCDDFAVTQGLAVYTDPIARLKVPDPTLRAALASLVGTVGQSGIPWLLTGPPILSIEFGLYLLDKEVAPRRFAGSFHYADGSSQAVIDGRYRGLPFGAFAGLVFHELLHLAADEDGAGYAEETVASSLEALVYMETLLVDPALALLPDQLTRFNNNHIALARLNSGPRGSEHLTLFVPDGTASIDPLASEPITQFADYYARFSAPDDAGWATLETEGNQLLRSTLSRLAEDHHEPPSDAAFDGDTLAFVDQNQAVLSPTELYRIACILRLDVPCTGRGPA
jgi:hypothetical protein